MPLPFAAPQLLVFLGKGGVGKSTLAAATALQLAERGLRVRLLSLDPAHNLGDLFGCRGHHFRPLKGVSLKVEEVDPGVWTKRYLREVREEARARFRYWTTLGLDLDGMIGMLAESPGVEEYALLRALSAAVRERREGELLVIDTPPTALALRILALAGGISRWTARLHKLRGRILKERFSLSRLEEGGRVSIAGFSPEEDPVSIRLQELLQEYSGLARLFGSGAGRVFVVATPARLALREAGRIRSALTDMGIAPAGLVLNQLNGTMPDIGELSTLPGYTVPGGVAPEGAGALRRLPLDLLVERCLHA